MTGVLELAANEELGAESELEELGAKLETLAVADEPLDKELVLKP